MINQFLKYLQLELNRSPKTIDAYGRDLRQFESFLRKGDGELTELQTITSREIRQWLAAEARAGISPRSLRRKTQSLRAFYRWMMKRGIIKNNPAAETTLAKTAKHLPEFVLPDRLEGILSQPFDSDNEIEAREHLIINLLYSTGMRRAELLALNDSDINLTTGEARLTGKRNKQRVVPLLPSLIREIQGWQSLRDRIYPREGDSPLLVTEHGRMSESLLYKICKGILSQTGATRLGPHTLRHSFASAMVDSGADLNSVREILGHESLATTQIYTHLSFNRLTGDYRKAHPRNFPSRSSDSTFPDSKESGEYDEK